MMNKSDYQRTHPNLHEGMMAYTRDGQELGRVIELADDSLTLEGGPFFPRDFTIRYNDIAEARADALVIAREEPELHEWREADYAGWQEYERRNVAGFEVKGVDVQEADAEPVEPVDRPAPIEAREESIGTGEGEQISLHEEQLEAHKVARQTGEVRVRKVVHTEIRSIDVPVTREEIVVERRPAEGGAESGEKAFQGEDIRIPVMEEEVEVRKRKVKKEDVNIRKEKHVEQKKVSGEVRSEDVEIDRTEKEGPGKGT